VLEISDGAGEALEDGVSVGAAVESFPQPAKAKAASRTPVEIAAFDLEATRDAIEKFIVV
jgi:hypothetical protein